MTRRKDSEDNLIGKLLACATHKNGQRSSLYAAER